MCRPSTGSKGKALQSRARGNKSCVSAKAVASHAPVMRLISAYFMYVVLRKCASIRDAILRTALAFLHTNCTADALAYSAVSLVRRECVHADVLAGGCVVVCMLCARVLYVLRAQCAGIFSCGCAADVSRMWCCLSHSFVCGCVRKNTHAERFSCRWHFFGPESTRTCLCRDRRCMHACIQRGAHRWRAGECLQECCAHMCVYVRAHKRAHCVCVCVCVRVCVCVVRVCVCVGGWV